MVDVNHIPDASLAAAGCVPLPSGVHVRALERHSDDRGSLTEVFRDSWGLGSHPVQWNISSSAANVLRGVHVHRLHTDYLLLLSGELILGLHDLRPASDTAGISVLLRLDGQAEHLIAIPPLVAHGFYFPSPACHLYAVTHDFDSADELGCRWDDPALALDWPCASPLISGRDARAGSLEQLKEALAAAGPR